MILSAFLQLVILLIAMSAAGLIGFWVAREIYGRGTQVDASGLREEMEHLRQWVAHADAEKNRALAAEESARSQVEAWQAAAKT